MAGLGDRRGDPLGDAPRSDLRDGVAAEVVVIGGGVVGCAIAAALAPQFGGGGVFLVESEASLGLGTTSRNSGVVHSGLYYAPGSWKARACVEGNERLAAWCALHDVPYRRIGKLVVARDGDERARLVQLHQNAAACGARGVELVDADEIVRLEPALADHVGDHAGAARLVAALWCPNTGIVDAVAFARSLAHAARVAGAEVLTGARVLGAQRDGASWVLDTTRGPLRTRRVINAAGFAAPDVARLFGVDRTRHHACRGDYFRWTTTTMYRRLLYPVRTPGAPGLGIHLTLDLAGGVRLGPDARYVDDASDVTPAEHLRAAFAEAASRWLGPVREEDLVHDGCGIRPKLAGPGEPDRDFVVDEGPVDVVHLFGIESPGLTASLALADEVRGRLTPT